MRRVDLHQVRKLPSRRRGFHFLFPVSSSVLHAAVAAAAALFAFVWPFSDPVSPSRATILIPLAWCLRACAETRTYVIRLSGGNNASVRACVHAHTPARSSDMETHFRSTWTKAAPFFRSAMHNERRKSNRSCIYLFQQSCNDHGPRFALCLIQIIVVWSLARILRMLTRNRHREIIR